MIRMLRKLVRSNAALTEVRLATTYGSRLMIVQKWMFG